MKINENPEIELEKLRRRISELEKTAKKFKKTKKALKESEERFRDLADLSPQVVYETDKAGNLTFVNQIAYQLFGYTTEDFNKGLNALRMLVPEDRERALENIQKSLHGEDLGGTEYTALKKDGTVFPVLIYSRPIVKEGKTIGLTGLILDISELKKALEKLRRSEERFRALAESATDAILTTDIYGKIIHFNQSLLDIFGYTRKEMLNQPVTILMPDKHKNDFQKRLDEFRSIGKHSLSGKIFSTTGLRKNGSEFPFEMSLATWQVKGERFTTSIIRDVSERQRAEEKLKKSERQLNDIINHLPDATFAIDAEGKVIAWNLAIEEMTRVKASQIMGKNNYQYAIPFYGERRPLLIDLIYEKEDEINKWHYKGIKKVGNSLMAETPFPKLQGRKVILWGKATPLYDENGEIVGAIESIRDITERKEIEYALEESEERFKELFNHMGSGVAVYRAVDDGEDFVIVDMNQAGATSTNVQIDEIKGKSVTEVFPGVMDMGLFEVFQRVWSTGKPEKYDSSWYQDKKISRWFENYIYQLPSGEIVAIYDDVTNLKKAEEELRESENLSRVLLDAPNDSIYLVDPYGVLLAVNTATVRRFGLTKEALVGRNFKNFLDPELAKYREEHFKVVFNTKKPVEFEDIREGVHFHHRVFPIMEKGKVDKLAVFSQDVTERIMAKKALEESEKNYRRLVEASPSGIVVHSEGKLVYANKMALEIMGISDADELMEISLYDFVPAEYRDIVTKRIMDVLKTGVKSPLLEEKFLRPDGTMIDVEVATSPTTHNNKPAIMVIFNDITARRKNEEALRESEDKYRTIFENSGTSLVFIEEDTILSLVNAEFESLSGYDKKELEGKKRFTDFVAKDEDKERMKEYHRLRRVDPESTPHSYEFQFKDKYGIIKNILVTVSMIPETNKSLAALMDITQLKEAEKNLQESQNTLKLAMDLAKVVSWEYDVDSDIFIFDDQFYSLYGTSAEQEGGTTMSAEEYAIRFIPSEESYLVAREINKAMETDDPNFQGQVEHTIIRADGEPRQIIVRFGVIKDETGRTIKTYGANQDITERLEAEQSIKDHAELLNLTHEAIFVHNLDNEIIFWNDGAKEMYGWSQQEALGKTSYQLLQTKFPEPFEDIKTYVMEKGRWNGELVHIKQDGSRIIVDSRWTLKSDEKGNPVSILEINIDITDRVRIRDALRESEERFKQVAESAGEWIWETDDEGLYIYSSPVVKKILGYQPQEIIGKKHIYDLSPPEEHEKLKKTAYEILNGKEPFHDFVNVKIHKNGSKVLMETNGIPHFNEEGKFLGYRGADSDITLREQAMVALRESEERYRQFFDNPLTGFSLCEIITDDQGDPVDFIYLEVNQAFEILTGLKRDYVLNKRVNEVLPPEDVVEIIKIYGKVALTGESANFEYPIPSLNKHYEIAAFSPKKGQFIAFFTDISERVLFERALRDSEKKYKDLIELLPQSVFETDIKGYFTFANQEAYRTFGFTPKDIAEGLNVIQVIVPQDHDRVMNDVARILDGEKLSAMEYTALRKDGSTLPIITYTDAILHNNLPTGLRGVVVDITKLKKAEENLKASLKEKEILLQEIHHRVKNNLQIISSLLNLQQGYVAEKETINVLQESQNRVLSMAMIHEMLYDSENLSSIDFSEYIQRLIHALFSSYGTKVNLIELEINVDEIFLNIETAVPCGLIISELVSNSLKYAFPEGRQGKLSIDFHTIKDEFELTVVDNGVGLPEDFDFRKTESLGLRLINALVSQLDGSIELDKSQGTKFTMRFKELIYKKRV